METPADAYFSTGDAMPKEPHIPPYWAHHIVAQLTTEAFLDNAVLRFREFNKLLYEKYYPDTGKPVKWEISSKWPKKSTTK